jgi:hypothetical protein
LHAVAGCDEISAVQAADPSISISELRLSRVDVSRDLAVIESPMLPTGNLRVSNEVTPAQTLEVIGYPNGISGFHRMNVITNRPEMTRIRNRIPPTVSAAFASRNSPALATQVLDILGDLQVGHSGAPALNHEGRVVAIVNGGIGSGQYGIGWAIPMSDAAFRPIEDVAQEVRALIRSEHFSLFTAEAGVDSSLGRRERNALMLLGLAEYLRDPTLSCRLGAGTIDFDPNEFINGLRPMLTSAAIQAQPFLSNDLQSSFTDIIDLNVDSDAQLSRLFGFVGDNKRRTSILLGYGVGRYFLEVLMYYSVAEAERRGVFAELSVFDVLEANVLQECLENSVEVNRQVLTGQAIRVGIGDIGSSLPSIEVAARSEQAARLALDTILNTFFVR